MAASSQHRKKNLNRDAYTLHTFSQPLFVLEELDDMHLLVGGGGGSSRTGVLNQLHILQITPPVSSPADIPYGIKLLSAIDTGSSPAMSASTADFLQHSLQERAHLMQQFQQNFQRLQQTGGTANNELLGSCRSIVESCSKLLAVSQGGSTALYFLTKGMAPTADGTAQQPTWFVTHVANVDTDETPGDPYQRVVKICRVLDQSPAASKSGSSLSDFFFFTGGADGSVKGFVVFAVDALNPKQSIKIDPTWIRGQLHREVISLSISSDSACVASCGREGRAFILSTNDGSLLKEIPVACVPNANSTSPAKDEKSPDVERRYLCCAVRFNPAQPRELFVAWIPVNKYQRNMPSYVMRLKLIETPAAAAAARPADGGDFQKYQLQIDRTKNLGTNPVHIDGLEVSRDGQVIAASLISGNVLQLDASTLNTRSTSRAPHDAPVNRFLYASNMIVGENALMSVGVDNKLVLHKANSSLLLTPKRFFLTWIFASLILYLGFHMLTTYKGLPTGRTKSRFESFAKSRASFTPGQIDPSSAIDLPNDTSTLLPPMVEKHEHPRRNFFHRRGEAETHHHHHQHSHDENLQPETDAVTPLSAPTLAIPRVDVPHSLVDHTLLEQPNVAQPNILVTPTALSSPSAQPLDMPYIAPSTTRTAAPSIPVAAEDAELLPSSGLMATVTETAQLTEYSIDAAKTTPTVTAANIRDHHHHHDDDGHDHSHHGHDRGHGHGHDHSGHHHHHHHHHNDKKKEYQASFAQYEQQQRPPLATMYRQPVTVVQTATPARPGLFNILRAPVITATASTTVTTGDAAPLQPTVSSAVQEQPSAQAVISTTSSSSLSASSPSLVVDIISVSIAPTTDAVITPTSIATSSAIEDKILAETTTSVPFVSSTAALESVTEAIELTTSSSPAASTTEATTPLSVEAATTAAEVSTSPATVEGEPVIADAEAALADVTATDNVTEVVDSAVTFGNTLSDDLRTTLEPDITSTGNLNLPDKATSEPVTDSTTVIPAHTDTVIKATTASSNEPPTETAEADVEIKQEPNDLPTTGGDIDGDSQATSPPFAPEHMGRQSTDRVDESEKTAAEISVEGDDIPPVESAADSSLAEDEIELPLERDNLPPIPLAPVQVETDASILVPPVVSETVAESNNSANGIVESDDATGNDAKEAVSVIAKPVTTESATSDAEQPVEVKPAAKKNMFAKILDMV